jgi:NADH-quinone oxidoreductase subunit H
MSLSDIVWTIIKIVIIAGFVLNLAGILTWADRRQSAMIQDRVGPNRAVIKVFGVEIRLAGLLHPAADGVKFFFKEDFMPPNADRLLFAIAPMLAVASVVALVGAIPFGDTLCRGPWLAHASKACSRPVDWSVVLPVAAVAAVVLGGGSGYLANWRGMKTGSTIAITILVGIASAVIGGLLIAQPWVGDLRLQSGACVDAAGQAVAGISPHDVTVFPAVPRDGLPPQCSPVDMMVAPLNVGILYIFAMAGQGIIGAAIAGWSSDNKFSLMGALRAASQMVSYEVTLGMSLIGAMMIYGTVRLDDMVRWQDEHTWGIFVQPLAFFLFFTAAVAENKRIPFDLPEAESELVSGYFTEYAGMKFGMFYFAEYAEVVTGSMLLVTIFLGGWALPFFHRDGILIQLGNVTLFQALVPHFWMIVLNVLAFFGKVLVVCWLQVVVRWTLPRFRYDQLMKLGWKILLPASLANILVTGVVWLALEKAGATA